MEGIAPQSRTAGAASEGRAEPDTARVRPAESARRSPRLPMYPSLEEAVIRAVARAAAHRRQLAREVRDLPPPLDTRLALLACVAEIRMAIVPPSLTTLDRRR